MRTLLAVIALFALPACTPEEEAAVIEAYAAHVRSGAEDSVREPTWSVEATCEGLHLVLTGWTGVTDISPSTGKAYAILSMGSTNVGPVFDETGGVDKFYPADQGVAGVPEWGWSLQINGPDPLLPLLAVAGAADC